MMNQMQVRYAIGRLNELLQAKLDDLRARLTTPAKTITERQRYDLIKSGKVKLRSDKSKIDSYTYVNRAFDFSEYESDARLNQPQFDRESAKLRTAASHAKDEIMLGTEAEAKRLISEFEAL